MPKFRVTAPDGRTIEVTAPEGATEQQAIQYAQQNWDSLSKQQPQTSQQPEQPQEQSLWQKEAEGVRQAGQFAHELGGGLVEPIARMATGMIAKPLGEAAGTLAIPAHAAGLMAVNPETGKPYEPAEIQAKTQEALTYQPRTEAGQSEYNPLNAVPHLIGKLIDALTPNKPQDSSTIGGMATNAIREAIPQAIAMAGAKGAPAVTKAATERVAGTLDEGAKSMMQSAIKPTLAQLKTGKAATAIDTMLEKGIPPTEKGVQMIRQRIDEINDQIRTEIKASPAKVDTAKLLRPVAEKLRQFRSQVNPSADISTIRKAWDEFKNLPEVQGGLSVQRAQELKQGTYQQLSKKYGQMGSAEVEAQKAIARGLKEQVAEKVPVIQGLNKEESRLIDTLSVTERRALMEANKNPMGLSLLAKNPATWAAFMADKSANFKYLLARTMHYASKKLKNPSTRESITRKALSATVPEETQRVRKGLVQ